ncbi:MAG: agmatine deiminase family protein [Candidatus Cloacimonetes bacterium]|nr:agmatine deiminase family protein [Candidatus Cloacimonadota bacterium]
MTQPLQPVRMCAEWEPVRGTLIRWPLGIPWILVVELAEEDSLYFLVENEMQQNQAYYGIIAAGANLDHCRFIMADTYSHWTRDWGPVSIFDGNGEWSIVDPIFQGYPWVPGGDPLCNRDWEEDNMVNAALAEYFSCQLFQLPAFLTGGNIMVDGHGTAFSTLQMLNENLQLMDEDTFFSLTEAYCGITTYHIVNNIEDFGIQHIDCAAKLVDEETVIIKQLPAWHPEYQRIELVAHQFMELENCWGRPYRIFRIFCDVYEGNNAAAYTNALILNSKVLVPLFNIDADTAALQTYQDAMPGYEINGIYYEDWYYYDALHCRTRGIFDRYMLHLSHRPLDQEQPPGEEHEILCLIDDRSESGLIPDELLLCWRHSGNTTWNQVMLQETFMADTFSAAIPGASPGTSVEYYISAADYSGRQETLPRCAPAAFFSFTVAETGAEPMLFFEANFSLRNYPNPFGGTSSRFPGTWFSFHLPVTQKVAIKIFNISGELVGTACNCLMNRGYHNVFWQPSSTLGSGIYIYQMKTETENISGKCLLLE